MVRSAGFRFTTALNLLLKGVVIYRRSWMQGTRGKSICLRPGTLIPAIDMFDCNGGTAYWKPTQEDIFATDWGSLDD